MIRVSLGGRRFSVSAQVPDAVASLLRRSRGRTFLGGRRGQAPGRLVIAERPPVLGVRRRDPLEALPFFRELLECPGARRGPPTPETDGDLARRVHEIFWYHSIELPGGVVTPGMFDHRPLVPHYGLPSELEGRRALDVATFDGFWAFELERRGAEVVAVDLPRFSACDLPPPVREALVSHGLDRPTGEGFRLAHELLGSKVSRIERSVYDLDPVDIGTFDFVHVADLLVHLENPLAALRAIRRVTHGSALVVDCYDPRLEPGVTRYDGGWRGVAWWMPALDTLGQMVVDAGFGDVQVQTAYSLPFVDRVRGPQRVSLLATI